MNRLVSIAAAALCLTACATAGQRPVGPVEANSCGTICANAEEGIDTPDVNACQCGGLRPQVRVADASDEALGILISEILGSILHR